MFLMKQGIDSVHDQVDKSINLVTLNEKELPVASSKTTTTSGARKTTKKAASE